MAIIKADSNSTFDDLINTLDELIINGINSSVTVPITPRDRELIRQRNSASLQ